MSEPQKINFTTAADVGRLMVEAGGISHARVDAVAAILRNVGLLPKGGRGRHAPAISFSQALGFLLVTASTPHIHDTYDTLDRIGRMTSLSGSEPFTIWLGMKMVNEGEYLDIEELVINPVAGCAFVRLQGGYRHFGLPEIWAADPDNLRPAAGYAGQVAWIGGDVLKSFWRCFECFEVEQ